MSTVHRAITLALALVAGDAAAAHAADWHTFDLVTADEYGHEKTIGKGIQSSFVWSHDLGMISAALFPSGEVSLMFLSADIGLGPVELWKDRQVVSGQVEWTAKDGHHKAAISFRPIPDRLLAAKGNLLYSIFRDSIGEVTFHFDGADRRGYKIDPLGISANGFTRMAEAVLPSSWQPTP